jgi:peptidyl-prolyl cis-trans isomerase C
MSLFLSIRTAVWAVALLIAAGTVAVRAQDTAPEPQAEVPPAAEAPGPAAEPAPVRNPTDVVARVGDQTVTEQEIMIAEEQFANELAQVPEEEQRSVLIDAVVSVKLLAQAARDEGLDQTEEFQAQVDFQIQQALRNAYIEERIVPSLTVDEVQKGYQDLVVSQHQPQEEVHARHILMATEEEAKGIIEQLNGGAAFEELAQQSLDQTGQNGGDLGFFGRGQMVPPFEEAAFALEPGNYTQEPVQSEFGWHVIRVEEKRMSEPQAFADVEEQLRSYLMRQKFETVLAELRQRYPVEIIGAPASEAEASEAPETEAAGETPEAAPAPGEQPTEEPQN